MLITDPSPSNMFAPVFHLMYQCVTYESLNHHLITLRLLYRRMSGNCIVTLRYCSNRHSMRQS